MPIDQYIKTVKYGNIYVNLLSRIFPLILWGFFIYKYYYPYYKKCKDCSPIFLFLLVLPFSAIFIELILDPKIIFSDKTQVPALWGYCFDLLLLKKKEHKGVLGVWNYNCGGNQTNAVQTIATALQNKFYYLNFALFLLILIYDNLSKAFNKKMESHHILFIAIALFCGTIGAVPRSYTSGYVWSLMTMMMFGTILNMNIAAFLIVLYTLFK